MLLNCSSDFHGGTKCSRWQHRAASPPSMHVSHAREWFNSSKKVSSFSLAARMRSQNESKKLLGGGGVVVHVNRRPRI